MIYFKNTPAPPPGNLMVAPLESVKFQLQYRMVSLFVATS